MTQYNRLATIPLAELMSIVDGKYGKFERLPVSSGHVVGVSFLRLQTFKRDYDNGCLHCSDCGIKATFVSIDIFKNNRNDAPPHANLYGLNEMGDEVLFTQDHTLARGLGGADTLENATTMCNACNAKKSKQESGIANARQFEKVKQYMQENPMRPEMVEAKLAIFLEKKAKTREHFTVKIDNFLEMCG